MPLRLDVHRGHSQPDAAFYFDLASPLAYLAAERVLHTLPAPAEWQPVLARELPAPESFEAFRCQTERDIFCEEIERRACQLGLQPLRWPSPFPFDSELAMRVATYAKSIGRAVPFALAAFRQTFAGGHSLQSEDFVLIAASACEMHPAAVLKAAERDSVGEQLRERTARAAALGVRDVPALSVGEQVFLGERSPEQAAAVLTSPIASKGEVVAIFQRLPHAGTPAPGSPAPGPSTESSS